MPVAVIKKSFVFIEPADGDGKSELRRVSDEKELKPRNIGSRPFASSGILIRR